MSSINKKDQESLVVLELANRQLRQDLTLALVLISRKKQTNFVTNKKKRNKFYLKYLTRYKQQLIIKRRQDGNFFFLP